MKYILQIKEDNKSSIVDLITKSSNIAITKCFYKGGSELWAIYNTVGPTIGFYNSISHERADQYRALSFTENLCGKNSSIFFIILARIRNLIGLRVISSKYEETDGKTVSKVIIGDFTTQEKDFDNWDELFKDNNIANPLIFTSDIVEVSFAKNNKLFDFTLPEEKNNNVRIVNMIFNNNGHPLHWVYNCSRIVLSSYYSYHIENLEEFLGCNPEDFARGIEPLDKFSDLSVWLNNGHLSPNIVNMNDKDLTGGLSTKSLVVRRPINLEQNFRSTTINPTTSARETSISVSFMIIKCNKKIITLNMQDFVSAIDSTIKVTQNCLDSMNKNDKKSAPYKCLWYLEKRPLFWVGREIFRPMSAFDFKPNCLNLVSGTYQ